MSKEFEQANEYMETVSKVLSFYMHFNISIVFVFLKSILFLTAAESA